VALSAKEIKGRMAGLPTVKPDQCLVDLGAPDAEKAYRAIWSLVGQSEEAIPMLEKWIDASCAAPIGRLINELDHAELCGGEDAHRIAGTSWARLADPAMQAALAGKLSAEARRRIERNYRRP